MPGKKEVKKKEAKPAEGKTHEAPNSAPVKTPNTGVAVDGSTVKVHYKGTLSDGKVFDSSHGKAPITFVIGEHQVIPGFENAIRGMKTGEKKSMLIQRKEAYGDRNPALIQKVPLDALKQAGITPQKGMILGLGHPTKPGMQLPAVIINVTETEATLDLNHPLAGKDLNFELELVEIN